MNVFRDLYGGDSLARLLGAVSATGELYEVALYGQRHKEANLLQILEKLGSRSASSGARRELRRALEEVSILRAAVPVSSTVQLKLSRRELELVRGAVRVGLRTTRAVPLLARYQAVVALSAAFEAFIADFSSDLFDAQPLALKSKKSTLTDEELVDAVRNSDPISVLKSRRLRNVMYGSVKDWFQFLRETFGMDLRDNPKLVEMFLARNSIVHSGGRVTKELVSLGKRRYRVIGNKLNITEVDVRRYLANVRATGDAIWREQMGPFGDGKR